MAEFKQYIAIIAMCITMSVVYGIIHDQITVRLCIEYFTIGHPPLVRTRNPTWLAIGWGILATWWVGLLFGIPLCLVARLGRRAKRDAASLLPAVSKLLCVMAIGSALSGILGWRFANQGSIFLVEELATRIPSDRHFAYLSVLWIHSAGYIIGIGGGLTLIVRTWFSRKQYPTDIPAR